MIKKLHITGYKPQELNIFNNKHKGILYIKKAIKKHLIRLLDEGLQWVIITGQLGVELWAGEVTIELKKEYPELKLAVLIPYYNQEGKWSEDNQEYYNRIIEQSDFKVYITNQEYTNPWQFKVKNKLLLEKTDGILIIYDTEKEGSPKYIMNEAILRQNYGYKIITITPEDLQTIIDEENLNC